MCYLVQQIAYYKIYFEMEAPPINEEQANEVFSWVNGIPFSRSVKNLNRDFCDGVLVAQIIKYHFPAIVQLHNYQPASSSSSKYVNWKTLNEKIFRKLGFQVHRNDIEKIIGAVPKTIERVLYFIFKKIQSYGQKTKNYQSAQNNYIMVNQYANHVQGLSSQLANKERIILELRETIEILQTKVKKMEQLNKLKDTKIDSLMRKIDENIGI